MTGKERQELQRRYGNLFDGITDSPQDGHRTQRECMEEARGRYGHLADYMKPDNSIYDAMMDAENMYRRIRQQREEACAEADIRRKEQRERERQEEQERIDRNSRFADSLLERAEAERRAQREAEEQRRREAEKEQDVINSLRMIKDIGDKMSETSGQAQAMLERDGRRRKEYGEQMEWYRKQQKN